MKFFAFHACPYELYRCNIGSSQPFYLNYILRYGHAAETWHRLALRWFEIYAPNYVSMLEQEIPDDPESVEPTDFSWRF